MGWNSWDSWGMSLNESMFFASAQVMTEQLSKFGYQYMTVDAGATSIPLTSPSYATFADSSYCSPLKGWYLDPSTSTFHTDGYGRFLSLSLSHYLIDSPILNASVHFCAIMRGLSFSE